MPTERISLQSPTLHGWRELNRLGDFVRTILRLSSEETAILDTVRSYQMPKTAAKIAKDSGVPRKNANRILVRFETRQLVKRFTETHAHDRWQYNKRVGRL